MNRRGRRAMAKDSRLDPGAVAFARSYKCPDCDSVAGEVTRDRFGVHHVSILHDRTCPRLKGITQ